MTRTRLLCQKKTRVRARGVSVPMIVVADLQSVGLFRLAWGKGRVSMG